MFFAIYCILYILRHIYFYVLCNYIVSILPKRISWHGNSILIIQFRVFRHQPIIHQPGFHGSCMFMSQRFLDGGSFHHLENEKYVCPSNRDHLFKAEVKIPKMFQTTKYLQKFQKISIPCFSPKSYLYRHIAFKIKNKPFGHLTFPTPHLHKSCLIWRRSLKEIARNWDKFWFTEGLIRRNQQGPGFHSHGPLGSIFFHPWWLGKWSKSPVFVVESLQVGWFQSSGEHGRGVNETKPNLRNGP